MWISGYVVIKVKRWNEISICETEIGKESLNIERGFVFCGKEL